MAATLVMLHGFTHTGLSWEPVIAALPTRYRALAPDIRGHGLAAGVRPVTLEGVIGDLEALAPSPFVLVGYSMGGRIALHAARALGERVQRLVLIGASPGIADASERAARSAADEQLAQEIESSSIEQFARSWAQTPVLAGLPPAIADAALTDRLRNTPRGLAEALRGLGTGALAPLWDRLGELRLPVTIVVGERDRKFREIGEQMGVELASADVVVVPDAGHAVHLEAPERVAAILGGERE